MDLAHLWRLLHLFFSFEFVGSLMVAEWNGRAARRATDWTERAALYHVVHVSARTSGIGALVLLGVFGHLTAVSLGYSMRTETWLWWVTGLWLAAIAVMALVVIPAAARLAATSDIGVAGGEPAGHDAARGRWRLGNVVMSLLYLALLALMVFRWRSPA
jgi:hypothetical protein